MFRYFTHMSVSKCGPMHPLEKGGHIANILNAVFGFVCAIVSCTLLWLAFHPQAAILPNHREGGVVQQSLIVILAGLLLVAAVALLWRSIRAEKRLKHAAAIVSAGIATSSVPATATEPLRSLTGKPLPELRPRVVAVSYRQLYSLAVLGFETANDGKEVAYDISIPDVKLGTSIIQFEGNYQRLTINEPAYWRVLIKHDTGGFSTGNALRNEMLAQGKGQIDVPIHFKDGNDLCYVTRARLELNASEKNGIAVHNDGQELIKWPTAVSAPTTEVPFPSTAPRPYLEVDDPIDESHGKTAFVFTNRGGDVAHNVQVAALCIAGMSVVFDSVPTIPVGAEKRTMPKVPGTTMHDVLSLMEREWDYAFRIGGMPENQEVNEWKCAVTVTYQDFTGKRFEATGDVICFPVERTLRAKHAFEQQTRQYKTVEVRNTKFRVVP